MVLPESPQIIGESTGIGSPSPMLMHKLDSMRAVEQVQRIMMLVHSETETGRILTKQYMCMNADVFYARTRID